MLEQLVHSSNSGI